MLAARPTKTHGRAISLALFHTSDSKRRFVLLTAYIDESGTHNSGITVLWAWLGNVEQWAAYEREIKALFAEYSVKVYHAKELRHSHKDFKGWGLRKKARFADAFGDIVNRTLELGCSAVLKDAGYEQYYASGKQPKKEARNTKYGICFRAIISFLLHPAQDPSNKLTDNTINFVAELGHPNQASTLLLFSKIKKEADPDIQKMLGGLPSRAKKNACR